MSINTNGDDNFDASKAHSLVRNFTNERLRPERNREPLAESLVDRVDAEKDLERLGKLLYPGSAGDTEPGSSRIDVFEEISQLKEVSDRLDKAWSEFQKTLSEKEPSNQEKQKRPDIRILSKMVKTAQEEHERNQNTAIGKTKSVFVRILQSMDEHKYLFSLLPSGDRYVSVLTGAMTVIVKATRTYQDIVSTIGAGLSEISDQVRGLWTATKVSPKNTTIKRHMASFYCDLFEFLALLLKEWYNKGWFHRARKGLGVSFLENIKRLVAKLEKYTEKVGKEQLSIMVEKTNMLGQNIGLLLERQAQNELFLQQFALQTERLAQERFSTLMSQIRNMHQDAAPNSLDSTSPCMIPEEDKGFHNPTSTKSDLLLTDASVESNCISWTTMSVRRNTAVLEGLAQSSTISRLSDEASSIIVDQVILLRLQEWVYKRSSEALWIQNALSDKEPTPNTLNALFMLASLRKFKIPVLSWFCTYDTTLSWTEEFIRLVYSLIHQAALLLPDHLSSEDVADEIDLSDGHFACLTGDLERIPEALKLLEGLISAGPSLKFLIVSGWQLLESREDPELQGYLDQFVSVVCRLAETADQGGRIFKVGFFTDGWSESLRNSENEKLLIAELFEEKQERLPMEVGDI